MFNKKSKIFTLLVISCFVFLAISNATAVQLKNQEEKESKDFLNSADKTGIDDNIGRNIIKNLTYSSFGLGMNVTVKGNGVLFNTLIKGLFPTVLFISQDPDAETTIKWNTEMHTGDDVTVIHGEQIMLYVGWGYLYGFPNWDRDSSLYHFFKRINFGAGMGEIIEYNFIGEIRTPSIPLPELWLNFLPFLENWFPDGWLPEMKIPLMPGTILISEPW